MAQSEFESLLDLGREDRYLEFKGPEPWDNLKHKIAKTAMAMSNLPGGGYIVVGMTETSDGTLKRTGVPDSIRLSFVADDVAAYINRYADPYVRIELSTPTVKDANYVYIRVHEFDEVPVVCGRNGGEGGTSLRQGAIYCRATRIPETVEVPSQTEMREILELATDKGVRKFIQRANAAGLTQQSLPSPEKDAALLFEEERGGV
jgi:predicted HTH transcriptional regulator